MKGIKLCGLLLLCTGCFASSDTNTPYTDANGYCVVDVNISNDGKYVQEKIINVPDIENHVLRVVEISYPNLQTKMCNGNTIVDIDSYYKTDYIDHDGPFSGYSIVKTKNGDSFVLNSKGNSMKKDTEKFASAQMTGRIISGTGSLSKATGTLQASIQFNRMGDKPHKANTFMIKYK